MNDLEIVSRWGRIPLVATPAMAKVISVKLGQPGQVLKMQVDNRYKDQNIRIVNGVVRGNKNTISLTPLTYNQEKEVEV